MACRTVSHISFPVPQVLTNFDWPQCTGVPLSMATLPGQVVFPFLGPVQ